MMEYMHTHKYIPHRMTMKLEISKSFFFGHLRMFVTLATVFFYAPGSENLVMIRYHKSFLKTAL